MKLHQFYTTLKEMIDEDPTKLEFDVVYSSDDEGNVFKKSNYYPTSGEFITDEEMFNANSKIKNAICIN